MFREYCKVSGVLFSLVALAHLLRIIYAMPIVVDGVGVPMWASWIALIIPAGLAWWAFSIVRNNA